MLPKAYGKGPFAWCMRAIQDQSPLFIIGTVYMFGSIWQGSHPLKAPTETNWPIPNLQESWSIPCRRPLCTSWPVAQNLVSRDLYSSLIQLHPFIPSSLHPFIPSCSLHPQVGAAHQVNRVQESLHAECIAAAWHARFGHVLLRTLRFPKTDFTST